MITMPTYSVFSSQISSISSQISAVQPTSTMRLVGTSFDLSPGKRAWRKTPQGTYDLMKREPINVDIVMWMLDKRFDSFNEMKLFLEVTGIEAEEDPDAQEGDMIAQRYDDRYNITSCCNCSVTVST